MIWSDEMKSAAIKDAQLVCDLYDALDEFRLAHFAWLQTSHQEDPDDATCYRMVEANKKAETILAKALHLGSLTQNDT